MIKKTIVKINKSAFNSYIVQIFHVNANQKIIKQELYSTSPDIKYYRCDNNKFMRANIRNMQAILSKLPTSNTEIYTALPINKHYSIPAQVGIIFPQVDLQKINEPLSTNICKFLNLL